MFPLQLLLYLFAEPFCEDPVKEASFPRLLSESPPTVYQRNAVVIIICYAGRLNKLGMRLLLLGTINVFRRWTAYLPQRPAEIRRTSPLSVFHVCHLFLWPPRCPAVTWLCLIPLRSSENRSLILATLCPTSLHNLPSPNFPYRSH